MQEYQKPRPKAGFCLKAGNGICTRDNSLEGSCDAASLYPRNLFDWSEAADLNRESLAPKARMFAITPASETNNSLIDFFITVNIAVNKMMYVLK